MENHRTFEISRSTDETTFATVRVGPVSFSHAPVTLRFTAREGYPANIIRIRYLRLVPVTDAAVASAPSTSPAGATTAMQQAGAALKTAIDTARKEASGRYLDELHDLEITKPALKDQISAEIRRVQKQGRPKDRPRRHPRHLPRQRGLQRL